MRLIALDFDGVICDSAPENATVAWHVCRKLWKDLFPQREITPEEVERFCRVRPYLETGFHNPLMTWMLQSGYADSNSGEEFAAKIPDAFAACGHNREELKAALGAERDLWLKTRAEEWFECNHLFPQPAEILKKAKAENRDDRIIILTTKEDRFVKAIFKHWDFPFPEEDIYGLERITRKENTLAELIAESGCDDVRFIEDRVETLIRFQSIPAMANVKLHFASWGYSTDAQKAVAAQNGRIRVVDSLAQLFE